MPFDIPSYGPWTDHRHHELEQWNDKIEKGCDNPNSIFLQGEHYVEIPNGALSQRIRLVRCRKCPKCQQFRTYIWQTRCTVEYHSHPRTWWLTFTHRSGYEPNYEDVKLCLKRIRKAAKSPCRYVVSTERGEQGNRLHWHMLLHCEHTLGRRTIERSWPHGHTHARLARTGGLGGYLAKYLSKCGKIRASQHYGDSYRALLRIAPYMEPEIEHYIKTGAQGSLTGITASRWGIDVDLETLKHPPLPFPI